MQNETSVTHRKNIESGLTIQWTRTSAQDSPDQTWDVVCYSDESRWLFDNSSGQKLTLLGAVRDGLNTAEILETDGGAVIALYAGGIQAFDDRESWVQSLIESDRAAAAELLEAGGEVTQLETGRKLWDSMQANLTAITTSTDEQLANNPLEEMFGVQSPEDRRAEARRTQDKLDQQGREAFAIEHAITQAQNH